MITSGYRIKIREVVFEAKHWYQAGGPDVKVDGLALCSLHHKLFDRGAFTLNYDLNILVSQDAKGNAGLYEWLKRFHGEKLNLPQWQKYYPDENFTRWHFKEVFKGEYRER